MLERKSKLKIGLVCDDSLDKVDGVQQYVLTLGAWLSKNGHEVHYLTSNTTRTDLPNMHSLSKNVAVRFNSNRNNIPLPAHPTKLREFIRQQKFDVLHIQTPYSPLLAGQIIQAAESKTAVIGTFHVFPHSQLMSLGTHALGLAVRWQLKRFDDFIAVSTAAQQFAHQTYGLDTQVVPNMLDISRFTPVKNRENREKFVKIVFLGRLVERKGALQLLKAVEFLGRNYKTGRPYEVVIGGKGPLFETLDQYVTNNNLGGTVRFTGFVTEEDKAKFLQEADIAVFPSTGGESFGISLIEAMAATPGVVLAGDNQGYRTVMEGSKNQLVDPYDTATFAHMLATYVDDTKRREAAHKWQKKHVQQFDTNVVAPQILQHYEAALQKRTS